ncbi:hypothetical protein [Nocardioides flavescens]|uniref:Uncharacterized protein n=1 Tax=Nocardioides flavescens TaxID=2691959 RepID=A0A6L7EXT3_9ACTN|nr:hypothetical protein [Nocardioides flavescens]MXG90338.1 hypothetical protein [Nocardioides flavescens]
MTAERLAALYQRVQDGPIRDASTWHWLDYNFTPGTEGSTYFAPLTLGALITVDEAMPGYADEMLGRLESIGGRDRNRDDYEAISQWLAELVVVLHLVRHEWSEPPVLTMEPTAPSTVVKKNPEVMVEVAGHGRFGVEVKSPNLVNHQKSRGRQPWQLLERSDVKPADLSGGVTLPRDNPVKDYLISADAKFAGFRDAYADFQSVLVIVWDDYVNEPLTALLSPASGLLTENSFHKDASGNAVSYPNVDAVLLMRHQHQLQRGMSNLEPVDDRMHFLDYGSPDRFPPHVLVPNPAGQPLDEEWVGALGGWYPDLLPGAENNPGSMVMWIDPA